MFIAIRRILRGLLALAVMCGPVAPATAVDFADQVAPIFETHCLVCHQAGIAKGGVSLATAADLVGLQYVEPGDPDASYLIELVRAGDDGARPAMPKEGAPLNDDQVARLREWIADGARWPDELVLRQPTPATEDWWSLQPLAPQRVPQPANTPPGWDRHPIDRFIADRLAAEGLAPNPPADPVTLLRRVTYDLTGLPPSPAQVETFVDECRRAAGLPPDAPVPVSDVVYQQWVDRLLASPAYGERWGRHWLDVVRFGESRGFERNEIIRNAWPFRDYVIRSLNADRPWDQVIVEHLAGDVVDPGNPQVEIGTAFLVCGPYDDVGNLDPEQAAQIRANTIDEMIRAVSETFLGLTIGCARCHDHKFDPIEQKDYYRLYASLAGVHHGARIMATADQQQLRRSRLEPLERQRDALRAERSEQVAAVVARGNKAIDTYREKWIRPAIRRTGVEETFAPTTAKYVRLIVDGLDTDPHSRAGYRIDEFEIWTTDQPPRNVARESAGAVARGASPTPDDFSDAYSARLAIDGQLGACWIAAGPELTIQLAEPTAIDRIVFSSDRTGAAGDNPVATFVSDYRLEVSMDGESWTPIASSDDRQPLSDAHREKRLLEAELTAQEREALSRIDARLQQLQRQIDALGQFPEWWAGQFRPADGPFHVFIGGSPQRPGAEVLPGSPQLLAASAGSYQLEADSHEAQRRLELARWLVDADNPLPARVLANRLWHYHFGQGIVDTPSDFGYMGGRPTHPELLDWLAAELKRHQWRLKPLHRLIVTSQTYRQSSQWREQAARKDADNRLLWRFSPKRLEAEPIRDTMLLLAGVLDRQMGGPGFRLYEYLQDNVATYVPLDRHSPATYRRAVYHHQARASRIDLLTDLDYPDCAFATPDRSTTITPLQSLTLMNHSFTLDMARQWAERISRQAHSVDDQIRLAFMMAFLRQPSDDELAAAGDLVERYGLASLCRAIFNSNEFAYVP